MRIRLPDDEGEQLAELANAAAVRRSKALSPSAWVRGAIAVAINDDAIAARIADAAPEAGHGGPRPGAGRPKAASPELEEENKS